MPLYDYRCHDCEENLTIRRSFSETSPPRCSACLGQNLTRLISTVSIVTSKRDRIRDLSWVDRNLSQRIKKKANGKLNPVFQETLDAMESS